MNLLHIPADKIGQYCQINGIVGLALDRLPSGRCMACEVRRDEEGAFRTPLAEMSASDFYLLASRMGLDIVESAVASENDKIGHAMHLRRMQERADLAAELRETRKEAQEKTL